MAGLTGVSAGDLEHRAVIGSLGRGFLAGQRIHKGDLRLRRLLVCPACIREDLAASIGDGTPTEHVRIEWTVRWVMTCPRHDVALVEIDDGRDMPPTDVHEISGRLAWALGRPSARGPGACREASVAVPWLGRSDAWGRARDLVEVRRKATPLERHVARRLRGIRPEGFAGSLGLDVAAEVSEAIGASLRFGRDRRMRDLSDDDLRTAGGQGFRVLSGGETALRAFLSDLQASHVPSDRHAKGCYEVLGSFHRFLVNHVGEPAYEPVLDIVRRHIMATTPVAAGTEILGSVVARRQVHSLVTIKKELNRPGVRIPALLAEAGLLPDGHEAMPANRVLVDAAAAVLEPLASGLALAKAARRIGTTPAALKLLVAAGLVEHHAPPHARVPWAFKVTDLDEFLMRIAVETRPIPEIGGSIQPLKKAGLVVSEPPTFLTRLIVERRLAWVGRRAGIPGWNALLVDVEEVRRVVRPAIEGAVRRRQLPALLGLETGTLRVLVDRGAFRTTSMMIHDGRVEVDLIDLQDVARFRAEHIRVRAFCREVGASLSEVRRMIAGSDIKPAVPVDTYGAYIYRRAELHAAWSGWLGRPPNRT